MLSRRGRPSFGTLFKTTYSIPWAWQKARFSGLSRDVETIDFSGWPIYGNTSLPDETAYEICGALAAREAEVPWDSVSGSSALHMVRETDSTPMDVPLHPGAERWYREHG